MRLAYTGLMPNLRNAAIFINNLDGNPDFWHEIRDKGRFAYSDWSSQRVERTFAAYRETVRIQLWEFENQATNAATDPGHPHRIYYARQKTGRSVPNIVNTLVHELVHNCDMFGDQSADRDFGHGDQSPEGKGDSAPWWIGALAERYCREEKAIPAEQDFVEEPFHEECTIKYGRQVDEPEIPLGELASDDPIKIAPD